MSAPSIREAVERLPPYRGLGAGRPPVKLDGNENPLGPSPRVVDALGGITPEVLSRYPRTARLREAWATGLGVAPEELLLTAGSGPALALAAELVLDPGDACVLLEPSFELYAWAARRRGADVVAVEVGRDLAFPRDALRAAVRGRQPRLVLLGCPDNPTGVSPSREELRALVDAAPGTLFLADEAYVEFTGMTVIDLAAARPNLLVTRTCSKALGLAGERIGSVIGNRALIERLARLNVPYPVTAVAAVLAEAALADGEHVARTVRQVERSKRRLLDGLAGAGLRARDTAANFVLLDLGTAERAAAVTAALATRGIAVRDRSHLRNLAGIVRISAGTDDETEAVLDALRTVAPGKGSAP